jgi:hypothetical protein
MIIDFTITELQILEFISSRRFEETSRHGKERIQSSFDRFQIVLDGVYSEYAVSKALNLHFDLNCNYRKFDADLTSHKGSLIDVKSTRTEGGNLNAVAWSVKKPADIYILTEIYDASVKIVGWIDRDSFLSEDNIFDVGNGPFYSLPQKYLKAINESQHKKTL